MVSLAILSTLVASAAALGVNCRGSGLCPANDASLAAVLLQIQQIQVNGNGGQFYPAGIQIACSAGGNGAMCAFFQNTSGGTADQAAELVQGLLNHGCVQCGSIPTGPDNDVSQGELTVNIVNTPCCKNNCFCPV